MELAGDYEDILVGDNRQEVLKPGFTRLNLPWFASDAEVDFILEAVALTCESAWKILPQYRCVCVCLFVCVCVNPLSPVLRCNTMHI